jgi:hypothetical protein
VSYPARKRALDGLRRAESAPSHLIENQGRFFDAWGCFAESCFPASGRDVSRETFMRKTARPIAAAAPDRRRDVSRETIFSSAPA